MDHVRQLSWTTLFASGVVAVLTYLVSRLVQHRRSYRGLPMPPHDFLWGHLKIMGETVALFPKDTHWQYLTTAIAKKYDLPEVWYLDLWPLGPITMVITDPDLALQVTGNHEHGKHFREKHAIDTMVGAGNIVTAEGPRWKHLHKQLSPAFSISYISSMRGMIAEEIMRFRGILNNLAESGEVVKMDEIGQRLMFDIIVKSTFGISLNAQEIGSPVLQCWEDMCRAEMVIRKSWNPIETYPMERQKQTAKTRLDALLTELVQQRFEEVKREKIDVSAKRGLGIMDLILREEIQLGTQTLDAEFLADALSQVKTLLIAGTGTTSDALCFTYMFLSTHPEVVQRLREEHDAVFTNGIDATYTMLCEEPSRLNNLTYTTNVIKEVLRFFPVGSTVRREGKTGSVTYKGQQYTTKGQMINPQAFSMHIDPTIFADPMKFDPDRFAREDFPRHAWRPFERGPRACLGQPLAMDELKILLLLTVREFDFECAGLRPSKTPAVEWWDLDLTFGDLAFQEYVFEPKPRGGMPMTVKRSN